MESIYLAAFTPSEREIILELLELQTMRHEINELRMLKAEVRDNTIDTMLTLIEDIDAYVGIFDRMRPSIPEKFAVTLISWCNRLRKIRTELAGRV